MADVKWTKEQSQAIHEKGSNILVAAAAGSGKTAVLVERIINKIINEKIDIDRLLVVTFTNAAAAEMRERVLEAIYQKLDETPENENLQRQITLLNKASICTIDSFCLDVVRNHFYELENISPNFRIADTTEIELLKQEVLEDIFEEKYESQEEDFAELINTYTSYRDDTPLKELILKIYTYIQSNPFPNQWLDEKVEMFHIQDFAEDFSKNPWGEILLKEVEEELIDDINTLKEQEQNLARNPELEKYTKTLSDDIDKLEMLKVNLNSWDKAYAIYTNLTFATWPRQKVDSAIKDQAKLVRDDIKKKLTKKLNKIFIYNSEEANRDIADMYPILVKLKHLIFTFGEEFSKRKRNKNIVDFNDIEHLALHILIKNEDGKVEATEIAKSYQEKFLEIAIDEYQDSNMVQEYILTAISNGNNIFMVGDVKQSIYKFRQACPDLFLDKYLKDIRKCLPCSNAVWKDISRDFNVALSTFCDENPDFNEHILIDAFGTPQEMADELLKKIPQLEINRHKSSKLKFIVLMCLYVVITLICISSLVYISIIKNSVRTPVNTETTVIIGEEVLVSSSDELKK